MKTLVLPRHDAICRAADEMAAYISENPTGTIAIDPGKYGFEIIKEAAGKLSDNSISAAEIRLFELCSIQDCKSSCFSKCVDIFSEKTGFNKKNAVFLCDENYETYEEQIASCGGIGYLMLELGERGVIGFNEPGTQFSSATHKQKLSENTRKYLRSLYGEQQEIPQFGYTMGISSITAAKRITLTAFGKDRADDLFAALYARTDSVVPSAFLQVPGNVLVIADDAAAEKL